MTTELTIEDAKALADRCWRSAPEFCRVFLPEWFPSKMPWVHRGLCALRTGQTAFLLDFGKEWWPEDIERREASEWTVADLVKIVTNFVVVTRPAIRASDGTIKQAEEVAPLFALVTDEDGHITDVTITTDGYQNAFILPRGYSKTTLINALNLRDLVYAEERFLLYVSETLPHASNQILTLRGQLESNELLRVVFGDQVPDRADSERWGEKLIELRNGCRAAALGSGGQVRGISKDAARPSRIVVDDFQNEETVKSPTQAAKDVSWVLRTLLPARQLFGKYRTKIDFIGTLLGPEAVMAVLMKDPDWARVRFGARDRQGDLLWAYALDDAKLTKLRAQYERLGNLAAFDYEYNSAIPIDDGIAFAIDKIVFVNRPSEWFEVKALVCDPAISENPKADFFALACVGMSKYGQIHVIDFFAEVGVEFNDQAEKFFDMHFAHMTDLSPDNVKHGVESIAYQRALKSSIESKMFEKSKTWGPRAFFNITPITHGKSAKDLRVQGILAPRVRSGHVSMEYRFPTLLGQMQSWGQPGVKKDGPDAVAMAIQLLDPYAALYANVANDDETPVDESLMNAPLRLFGGRNYRKAP